MMMKQVIIVIVIMMMMKQGTKRIKKNKTIIIHKILLYQNCPTSHLGYVSYNDNTTLNHRWQ